MNKGQFLQILKKKIPAVLLVLGTAAVFVLCETAKADDADGLIYGTIVTGTGQGNDSITIGDSDDDDDDLIYGSVVLSGSSSDSSSTTLGDDSTEGLIYGVKAEAVSSMNGITIDYSPSSKYSANTTFEKAYAALEMYVYLREQGFTAGAACGVLGNAYRESNFEVDARGKLGEYGVFQNLGMMETKLRNYCTDRGLDVETVMGQTIAEIECLAPFSFDSYSNMTLEDFKQISDPAEAAEIWRKYVEQNNYSAEDTAERQSAAQRYYAKWQDYDGSGFEIIEEAMKYVGGKYVFGGDSLTDGIDCSHYVCRILRNTGHYNLDYLNSLGLRNVGTTVSSLSEAQPGDVLCWNGHVAFYITDDFYVNAASPSLGICVGEGDIENMLNGLITIRRIR